MHAEVELDAVPGQGLAEPLAEEGRLLRQHVGRPLDEDRLAPESTHRLGHLDADRAAAEDQ